jgi:hypothetical protein
VRSLPDNTTDRLNLVADIVELTKWAYNQDHWFCSDGYPDSNPGDIIGRGFDWESDPDCGTYGCIAGWAVALTPDLPWFVHGAWTPAGAIALGLKPVLATHLFRAELPLEPHEVADALRRLAKLPEGERGCRQAAEVLTPDQYRQIIGVEEEQDMDVDIVVGNA